MSPAGGPALVVMAAGASRRFGRLKQLEPLGPAGETLLEYSVYDAMRAGFQRLVVVLSSPIADEFRRQVGSRLEQQIDVDYAVQDAAGTAGLTPRAKPWGTAHAILAAAPYGAERFGVINADDYYGARSFELLHRHLALDSGQSSGASSHEAAVLVAFELRNTLSPHGTVSRGVCRIDSEGQLAAVDETFNIAARGGQIVAGEDREPRPLDGAALVSMNMWGFNGSLFGHLEDQWRAFVADHGASADAEFFLPDVVTNLIRQGWLGVDVVATPETWFGLTHSTDKDDAVARIRELTAAGSYPTPLWSS
jgi:hypothetical protein